MNLSYIISQLENNIPVYQGLFSNISDELIHWRPRPDKWNILEIVCHLYDEEREDFRARLKLVLENPSEQYLQIDPAGWVRSRNYDSKDFQQTLDDFIKERKSSVHWLKSLVNPNFENAFQHPKFGPLTGKLFLSNWLAHDYLHFRQIVKVKFDYLAVTSGEDLRYAGSW